ncbi:tRNA-2-methylthio-N(6)-dimethylallyladenosine synthase [Buchnera aphidicola (Thelaxes suberi)]|uniref:tRNA (N6-isopentenyl adenosine(37)-C2)-methylthiotransferase MiaB n=1 Tax=Buchnera aphidicola TaxID=9 RepID=UPI003464E539
MKKFFIKTWGCQMNEYDSSIIINLLHQNNNFVLTTSEKEADILILNTCSIRNKSQEKVFDQLGRWKKLKKKKPYLIIAVGGCVAQQEGVNIYKRANYVNIIFGPKTLHRLPNMIYNYTNKLIIDINCKEIKKFDFIQPQHISPITKLVSIMEGCNKFCSFCIVPYTRGKEINRPYKDILKEINEASQTGSKEVILLGQNVNAYKYYVSDNKIINFAKLLRLIAKINNIKRIRFITSYPTDMTDELIETYRDIKKIVSFLHLPVQSGSNRILKMMKRRYNINEYKKIISKLIKARNNIQISSDFIIGFPGETNQDFEETINFIQDINFDMSFSFLYSPRPGTPASKLHDLIDIQEKKKRLFILQQQINKQTLYWSNKMLDTIQMVLVHGPSKKDKTKLCGYTENNRTVHFHGFYNMIGKIVPIKIKKISCYNLEGEIIN